MLPKLATLHRRHKGLTKSQAKVYSECASVCLSRHHVAPVNLEIESAEGTHALRTDWTPPTDRVARTYANRDDATRDAAYGVSIAAAEAELGLYAFGRAETRTGAD